MLSFFYIHITFLATWGCASDFFIKMLSKFKMAHRGQLQIILWAQKLLKLKARYYSNFTITFTNDMEMCR